MHDQLPLNLGEVPAYFPLAVLIVASSHLRPFHRFERYAESGWPGREILSAHLPRTGTGGLNDPASMSINVPQPQQKGKVHAYHALPPASFWSQRPIALAVPSGRIADMDATLILVQALKLARPFIEKEVSTREVSYKARAILSAIDGALYEAGTANEQPLGPPDNAGGDHKS
jgi:hypothetical protein